VRTEKKKLNADKKPTKIASAALENGRERGRPYTQDKLHGNRV